MVYIKSYCKGLVLDRSAVETAYDDWAGHEAGKKNAHRVIEEHGSRDGLVDEITAEIAERRLSFRPIRTRRRRDPISGKMRDIGIESVKQQVCDYVAVRALSGLLSARVGFWQVASVKGKGQAMLSRACRKWVEECPYHAHLDIYKCYPSIPCEIVERMLRTYCKSADVLYLCRALLGTYGGSLVIGSYFSLRMAQLVLSFGYHMLEGEHKERRGRRVRLVEHQGWYADDIFLFAHDKRDLKMAVRRFERYMEAECGLTVKGWKIKRSGETEPVDAIGYTVRPGRTTIKSGIYLRLRRAYADFAREPSARNARRVCSYWGYLEHSDSHDAIKDNGYRAAFNRARKIVAAADRRKRKRKRSTDG